MDNERLREWEAFVKALYDECEGEPKWCNPFRIGLSLGWDDAKIRREVAALRARNVLQTNAAGGPAVMVALTDRGIQCAEEPWLLGRLGITEATPTITTHLHGSNARVNISSIDQSTNVVETPRELFAELRAALDGLAISANERAAMRAKIDELEASHGGTGFLQKYQDFIALAANHMTVLAPFMPALARLLS